MMKMRFPAVLFVALAGSLTFGATLEAPGNVKDEAVAVKISDGPRAVKAGDKIKISFALSAASDVEVAILNTGGRVVRHLAAGLLGPNAPEPFKKDSLTQDLDWDLNEDAGKPAGSGPFKVRVRAGLQPRLDKYLGREPDVLPGGVAAITVNPKGELFVLLADAYRGQAEIRVLDREGKYLRTIVPYPAGTPDARLESVGSIKIDGRRYPLIFNGQGQSVYPVVAGLRGQSMAWHPKGYLIAASSPGSMCNHGPARYLIAFHPEGGAPEGVKFQGPKIRNARGFLGGAGEGYARGMDRIAVSPDGEWIYFVQDLKSTSYFEKGDRQNGVFRVKWSDPEAATPWIGKKEAGKGDEDFDDPTGLAVDAAGNLLVCDRNNDRVKVYSPDGKRLGQFSVPQPEQIALDPKNGEIYLMCRKPDRLYDMFKSKDTISSRLFKLAAWSQDKPGEQPAELAKFEFANREHAVDLMALDATGPEPRLWVFVNGSRAKPGGLMQATVEGATFKFGQPVHGGAGLGLPSFLVADPERNRIFIYEHLNGRAQNGHKSIDIQTGKVTALNTKGSDLAMDAAGNLYVCDAYGANSMSRYDSNWKPLNFDGTNSNKISYNYRAYGPSMGLRGHVIGPNGDLYIRRSPNHALVSTVDVYGPDGQLKKAGLVNGAGSGDSGIGVDNRGNIYLGMNLKPANKVIPDDFAKVVPGEPWKYYRRGKREAPWCDLYANPYLFHLGCVMKFGPEGGRIFGNFTPKEKEKNTDLTVDKAPADATAYKSAYLGWDVKVAGAQWRYPGVGIIPQSFDGFTGDDGCECLQSQLDADPYGRVYAPSVFYSSIEWLDSAGNRIARIGSYGNVDDGKTPEQVKAGSIHFIWPCETDYAEFDGKLYVTDSANRRVVAIGFEPAAEAGCGI